MATMSEVNQAAINGMSSNGQDHMDSHSTGQDSPSKSLMHTQDILRFPSKFDIHREKTPVPENVSDTSAPAAENSVNHSNKQNEVTDAAAHPHDPAAVVISPAKDKGDQIEEPTGTVVEKFDEDSMEKLSDDAEASNGAEVTSEAATEEEEPVAEKLEAEEKPTDLEMTDDSKPEEAKVDETDAKQAEDEAEEHTEGTKSAKRGRKGGRKQAATPKKKEGTADESASSSPRRTVTPRKRKTTEGDDSHLKDADKTPLLEAPLIVEGKRSRQRVDRLDVNINTPDKKEIEIPHGKGRKFGEISFIEAMISKTPFNDLKTLHRLVFGKAGTGQEIKRNLRQFSGFGFDASSKDWDKKKKSIEHVTMPELKSICGILGLEKLSKKEEVVGSLMNFLVEPTDKGKAPPTPKSASSRKRAASSSASKKKTARKRTSRKSGASAASEESATEEEDQDKEEQSGVSEKEKSDVEEAEPPAKKTRRGRAPAPATPASSKKQVAASPSKSAKKTRFPSDAELKNTVKELLKGVNLEAVTMKEMTTKVYSKYPDIDLTGKKEYIKDAVKTLLSSSD